MYSIGIDIGGTRIKAVAIDVAGQVLHEQCQATNDGDNAAWKQAVAAAVQDIQHKLGQQQVPVGISAPGLPDARNNFIACMPGRMQGLEHFNWSQFLHQPAFVLNDAVAAMMGEAYFGAAKGKKNVLMITLGTGVGGAILIDGKPYQGFMNKAGHIGHMVIDENGDNDVTGMPGSLEECIGNYSIQKRTNRKFSSTQQLLDAVGDNDVFAKEVWLRSVRRLALGLASVANLLSPEVIVVGGGIAAAGDQLFNPLQHFMKKYEWQPDGLPTPIVKATCGDMAGAIGVARFASNKVNEQL